MPYFKRFLGGWAFSISKPYQLDLLQGATFNYIQIDLTLFDINKQNSASFCGFSFVWVLFDYIKRIRNKQKPYNNIFTNISRTSKRYFVVVVSFNILDAHFFCPPNLLVSIF